MKTEKTVRLRNIAHGFARFLWQAVKESNIREYADRAGRDEVVQPDSCRSEATMTDDIFRAVKATLKGCERALNFAQANIDEAELLALRDTDSPAAHARKCLTRDCERSAKLRGYCYSCHRELDESAPHGRRQIPPGASILGLRPGYSPDISCVPSLMVKAVCQAFDSGADAARATAAKMILATVLLVGEVVIPLADVLAAPVEGCNFAGRRGIKSENFRLVATGVAR